MSCKGHLRLPEASAAGGMTHPTAEAGDPEYLAGLQAQQAHFGRPVYRYIQDFDAPDGSPARQPRLDTDLGKLELAARWGAPYGEAYTRVQRFCDAHGWQDVNWKRPGDCPYGAPFDDDGSLDSDWPARRVIDRLASARSAPAGERLVSLPPDEITSRVEYAFDQVMTSEGTLKLPDKLAQVIAESAVGYWGYDCSPAERRKQSAKTRRQFERDMALITQLKSLIRPILEDFAAHYPSAAEQFRNEDPLHRAHLIEILRRRGLPAIEWINPTGTSHVVVQIINHRDGAPEISVQDTALWEALERHLAQFRPAYLSIASGNPVSACDLYMLVETPRRRLYRALPAQSDASLPDAVRFFVERWKERDLLAKQFVEKGLPAVRR